MSMTAGYRPPVSPGRYTSPTRLTPSLAGIVTSESLVIAAAGAGAAADAPPATSRAARTKRARTGLPRASLMQRTNLAPSRRRKPATAPAVDRGAYVSRPTRVPVGRLRALAQGPDLAGKPASHRFADGFQVGGQAVVTGDDDDRDVCAARWLAERVSGALHDERRHTHGVQLVLTGLARSGRRAPRRAQRKGQAQDGYDAALRRGATGHPRPGGPTPGDQRQAL